MKKYLQHAICACVICVCAIGVSFTANAQNLVENGGFERVDAQGKTIGWKTFGQNWSFGDEVGFEESRGLFWTCDSTNKVASDVMAQNVKLQAGKRYRVSVVVRTQNVKGNKVGAYLEWYGSDGHYKGGVYLTHAEGITPWTPYSGITTMIPTGIVRTIARPYVPQGTTGKAWFDSFRIEEYVAPYLDGVYSDRYRNAGASGKVAFRAVLNRLEDDTVGYFAHKALDARHFSKPVAVKPQDGVATWVANIEDLAGGDNVIRFALYGKKSGKAIVSQEILFTRQTPEEERAPTVRIDAYGRTLVNGRPFFPLGMYWHGVTESNLNTYVEGPFNCLMPYVRPDKAQMDLCEAKGVKVLYNVVGAYPVRQQGRVSMEQRNRFTRILRKYRNHPALLAWYVNDEMPPDFREGLSTVHQLVAEVDPNHPTWIAIYQHGQVRDYIATSDVIGTDPYPLFRNPINMVSTWTRNTQRGLMGMRPMWQIPQVFNKGAYESNRRTPQICKAPSEQEVRNMAWQCLAHGANGLIFYSFFDLLRMDHIDPFAKRWAEVKRVAVEIKNQERFFLSTDPAPVVTGTPDDLAIRAWRCEKEILVAAVNTTRETRAATVRLPELVKTLYPVLGTGISPTAEGALNVALPPIGVALVTIPCDKVARDASVVPPVKVIFDTDMLTDFDDVGALACLHALADAGECEILATVTSSRGNASVGAVQVINHYYGRGDIPVGSVKGMGVVGSHTGAKSKVDPKSPLGAPQGADGGHWKYRKLLADYPRWYTYADADEAPDANEVYRKVLAKAPDHSVTVCSVGFLTNLRRLLETPPDRYSPLNGRDLVACKVCKCVLMACKYPRGKEYNSMNDPSSSRIVLDAWPTPIVFSEFEYGFDTYAGRRIAEMPGPANPVKDVFAGNIPTRDAIKKDAARLMQNAFGMAGRAAWDETAVLVAVRGENAYFNVSRGTFMMVGNSGENVWVPDAEKGRHLRITEKLSKSEVGKIIDELICRPPRALQVPPAR